MQDAIKRCLVALVVLLFASAAHAGGSWRGGSDTGSGGVVRADQYVMKSDPLYYFIAATTSAASNTYIVPRGRTVTVSLNANTGGTGSNTITVNLMRRISYETAVGVNNGIIVAGTAITGAGNTAMIWEVPFGEYWVEIPTPTASGDSLVVVDEGIAAPR